MGLSMMLACCEPNLDYLAGRAASVFMFGCLVVGVIAIIYFVLRDVFRLARARTPLSWLAAIGAVLTGAACLAAGATGLIVAPGVLGAYMLGRWRSPGTSSQ